MKVYLKFAFKELKGLEITGIQKSATSLYIAHKEYLYILLSRLVSHCGSIYVHFHFFFNLCRLWRILWISNFPKSLVRFFFAFFFFWFVFASGKKINSSSQRQIGRGQQYTMFKNKSK